MTETKNDVCHDDGTDDDDESHSRCRWIAPSCSFLRQNHASAAAFAKNDDYSIDDVFESKSTMPDESPGRHNIL